MTAAFWLMYQTAAVEAVEALELLVARHLQQVVVLVVMAHLIHILVHHLLTQAVVVVAHEQVLVDLLALVAPAEAVLGRLVIPQRLTEP
jgi:hypothetical protein